MISKWFDVLRIKIVQVLEIGLFVKRNHDEFSSNYHGKSSIIALILVIKKVMRFLNFTEKI